MRSNPRIFSIRFLTPLALVCAATTVSAEPSMSAPPTVLAAAGAGQAAGGDMMAQRGAQMAFMSGSTHGAVEACGASPSAQLTGMAREQKNVALQMGFGEADFDAKFKEGYEVGKASVESSSPQERSSSCDGLRSTGMISG